MANDRMFLRCPCGSYFMLAKHFVTPWGTNPNLEQKLDAWFDAHVNCAYELGLAGSEYPTKPRLVFESDDDYRAEMLNAPPQEKAADA
jgi:hypothetical protein